MGAGGGGGRHLVGAVIMLWTGSLVCLSVSRNQRFLGQDPNQSAMKP